MFIHLYLSLSLWNTFSELFINAARAHCPLGQLNRALAAAAAAAGVESLPF